MKSARMSFVALLALTACGGSSGYGDHQFDSTVELRDVLARAGYECGAVNDKARRQTR
jgi:hypothetical protein